MRGQGRGITTDALGRLAAAQGQQFADRSASVQKRLDRLQHSFSIAKPEGTTRALELAADPAVLGAFHQEGNRRPGGDGVDSRQIASLRRAEDDGRIAYPTERAKSKKRLVFQPDSAARAVGVDVLATDGAGGARVAGDSPRRPQHFGGKPFGVLEGTALEIARGQRRKAIEGQQVRHRAQLTVLFGRRAERKGRQSPGQGDRSRGIGKGSSRLPADGDGLDALGSQDRAQSAAPACRPSWLMVANGIRRSPAGPIAATCQSAP